MVAGAIEGMLDSLGDRGHTAYLTADDFNRMESDLHGQMEGIGARMTMRKGRPTILQTLPDSPARAAGLEPGDILVEVDGKPINHQSLQAIVDQVRGPAGTKVKLGILRDGEGKPREFEIARAKVEFPEVTWHLLPRAPIAHLALREFGLKADDQLKTALDDARRQGAKGIILDLRGNPGGLKDQAVKVASEFLADGDVFIEQDANGNRSPVPVDKKKTGVATDIPLVCLIDEGTASAAEILAGALQDHNRARLVGTQTFGTGTVLEPFKLSDGSGVLLAVAEWLTPKGRQIWHKGISPDVVVTLPESVEIELPEMEDRLTAESFGRIEDKQLLKAFELLKEQLR
jgi:carboxyl-terminal processing protease